MSIDIVSFSYLVERMYCRFIETLHMKLNNDVQLVSLKALEKKKLIACGKLDKHGKPNQSTPEAWKTSHPDLRWILVLF